MPIQIIWGNDLNACDKHIQNIINQHVSKNWEVLNISKLNGDDPNQVIQALEEAQIPPFGEGARIIVLKNNPIFNNKNETLTIKFELNALSIPDSNFLILQNIQKPDARIKTSKFLKKLIQEGKALENSFSLPNIWDFDSQIKFIENIAKNKNICLEEGCGEVILSSVGMDSSRLNNELNKAILYIEAKSPKIEQAKNQKIKITLEDANTIFSDHQSNIFKIIDFIISNNISDSLNEINSLINQGEPALKLLSGLISQIRIHTIVLLLSNEKDTSKIAQLAGISNPKRIFFLRKKVSNCSPEYLINIMIKLLSIESLIKKGNNPINAFTENLLL